MSTTVKFNAQLKKLNRQQRAAVEAIEGPVMVIAGPGTGKTQVVAMRIANILHKTQMEPNNILALTFTEAGVTALRTRLIELIGPVAYRVTVATFHGFANEVIGIFPHLFVQTQSLRQISDADRYLLIEEILNDAKELKSLRPLRKPDLYVYEISQKIKTVKQENFSPEKLKKLIKTNKPTKKEESNHQRLLEFIEIYQRYNQLLSERGWYDYEDTIQFVVEALNNNDEVRSYFQERYQYMLVDEYQDSNNSQNALVEVLANFYRNPNLFVVGDDKQAIYRFQGASVANMLHFKQLYPEMKIISLSENYRSTPQILNAADALISNNTQQLEKIVTDSLTKLKATKKSGPAVRHAQLSSQLSEYVYLVEQIKSQQKLGVKLSDMSVLFRRRQSVEQFAAAASKMGVALSGQVLTELFENPLVRSLLRLLQAVAAPNNNLVVISALRPILNDKDLIELYRINSATRNNSSLIEKLLKASPGLSRSAKDILEANRLSESASVQEVVEWLLTNTQHIQDRAAQPIHQAEQLIAFIELVNNFSKQNGHSLSKFLAHVQAIIARDLEVPVPKLSSAEGLFVGTVHSAKGLEFEKVYIAEAVERRWSLRKKAELIKLPGLMVGIKDWEDNIEEDERRLFYVAVTRAKSELVVTSHQLDNRNQQQIPCQFIHELGEITEQSAAVDSKEIVKQVNNLTKPLESVYQSVAMLNYVREKIEQSPLSYSDLRAFQQCPQQYLFSRVLRLPQPESESLVYGNVVHKALEQLMREFRSFKKLPSKDKFINYVTEAATQLAPAQWREKITAHASEVLEKYYQQKSSQWRVPVGVEYSFTHHRVQLGDIWLTGKFDRIDTVDPTTRAVRIIDYKTKSRSISRNVIEGKTKNSDGEMLEQLMFYAVLAVNDPMFPYQPRQFQISVIDDTAEFKDEVFEFTNEQIRAMEQKIISIKQDMLSQKTFEHTRSDYDGGCEICRIYS